MRKNLVAKLAIILLGLAAAFCSKAEIIQTTGATSANSAPQTVESGSATDALEFGPGCGSQFAISSSEKAYVVGVYGLTWDQFKFRSGDNTYVFADDRLIDREKGSGTGAPDHQWCGTYADMVVSIWTGWSKYAGYSDEDAFAHYLVSNGIGDVLSYVESRSGKSLSPYKSTIKADATLAKSLSESFASADRMMSMAILFENYVWYGSYSPLMAHAVVCCGYSIDSSKPITDPACLKGLFIIDPDNDRENNGGGDNAPDTVIYCPVNWEAANARYAISGIFGTIGYLDYQYIPSVMLRTEKTVDAEWSAEPRFTIDANGVLTHVELEGISKVIVPDGVKKIGAEAFAYCGRKLTEVVIPNGVTHIEDSAFEDCYKLEKVTIPDTVVSIGNSAFSFCSKLSDITLPPCLQEVGYDAFFGCAITKAAIPSTMKEIPVGMFGHCAGLESVSIPQSIVNIGKNAFIGCRSLGGLDIPTSVVCIGREAFAESGLKTVCVPPSVKEFGDCVFQGCTNLTKATIASAEVGVYAFGRCEKLSSLSLGDGVLNIRQEAFSGCEGLTGVVLPDSVTNIGHSAFRGCAGLGSVNIPANVSNLGHGVFGRCLKIAAIGVSEGNKWYKAYSGMVLSKDGTTLWTVPGGMKHAAIPEGVTHIEDSAFSDCRLLESVSFPQSLADIGPWAFDGCVLLSNVEIPESVTNIGKGAFWNCQSIKRVKAPLALKTQIEDSSNKIFYGCSPELTIAYMHGDGVCIEAEREYETGMEIEDVPVYVDRESVSKIKISGLPSGLKFTEKDIYKKGSKTEIEHQANTIYGKPTKSGVYTVIVTATMKDKKTATYSQTIIVRKPNEKVVVPVAVSEGGEVKGGGVYASGKKVTLKATAKKGFVFAGWYGDEDFATPCDSAVADYRNPSYAYTMGASDKMFYARFEPAANDTVLDLTVGGLAVPATFTVSESAQLPLDVESLSLPKISVKGLPAGMKFTAKAIYRKGSKTEVETPANTIYGAPTKPGMYKVSVSISNTSVKKAIVKQFTIEVPNLTGANGYFAEDIDNGIGKKCVLSAGISNIDDFLPGLELNRNVKLAVKGLPSGLKYDAKTGRITGVATKPGTYTVTLTVTDGKDKFVSTFTVEVEALPKWIAGTFDGYVDRTDSIGSITLTIGQNGKVVAKERLHHETKWVSLNFLRLVLDGQGNYMIVGENLGSDKDGEWRDYYELQIGEPQETDGVAMVNIRGIFAGEEYRHDGSVHSDEGTVSLFKNVWKEAKGTKLAPEFPKDAVKTVDMSAMGHAGILSLKFGKNGAVTAAYSLFEGGKASATGSAQLVSYEVDGNTVKALLYVALAPKGSDPFGVLLFLEIDTSRGIVYGEDVRVADYLLEVDD